MHELIFELTINEKINFNDWYKNGNDPIKFPVKKPFFMPDCIENIKHDVPAGYSFTVNTVEKDAVFGFVANKSLGYYSLTLPENYRLIKK